MCLSARCCTGLVPCGVARARDRSCASVDRRRRERRLRCRPPGRHRRSLEPGAHREGPHGGDRRQRPLPDRSLRPGSYTVTFTLAGFTTVKREGIEVVGIATTTVNAELRVGAVSETITVTGAAPTVDTRSIRQERVISRELLDTLPFGRTPQTAALLTPGASAVSTFGAIEIGGTNIIMTGGGLTQRPRQPRRRFARHHRRPVDVGRRRRGRLRQSPGQHRSRAGGHGQLRARAPPSRRSAACRPTSFRAMAATRSRRRSSRAARTTRFRGRTTPRTSRTADCARPTASRRPTTSTRPSAGR